MQTQKSPPRIFEAISAFIATVSQENKASYQGELSKFMRWFGGDRSVADLNTLQVENYQEQVVTSGADPERRLRPFKDFLAYAQSQKWIPDNLGKYIRLKRSPNVRRGATGSSTSVSMQEQRERLTQEGYGKLQEELNNLVHVERPRVAEAILEARRDRDIRENAGFAAAKEHQSHIETRIQQLQQQLARAEIISANGANTNSNRAAIGAVITLRELDTDEVVEYTLVSAMEADVRTGKISVASPVGKALLDRGLGEEVEVAAPVGAIHYRIERIEYGK